MKVVFFLLQECFRLQIWGMESTEETEGGDFLFWVQVWVAVGERE